MPKKKTNNKSAEGGSGLAQVREDPFYEHVKQLKEQRNQARAAAHKAQRPKRAKVSFREEARVGEGEKRKIDYQIQKNKGLTKRRRKESRNSRVKLKNKYSKAVKKLRALQPGVKDHMNPVTYDGEASGINMRVVKSVSLKGC